MCYRRRFACRNLGAGYLTPPPAAAGRRWLPGRSTGRTVYPAGTWTRRAARFDLALVACGCGFSPAAQTSGLPPGSRGAVPQSQLGTQNYGGIRRAVDQRRAAGGCSHADAGRTCSYLNKASIVVGICRELASARASVDRGRPLSNRHRPNSRKRAENRHNRRGPPLITGVPRRW